MLSLLLETSIRITLLSAIAATVLLLFRVRNASVRYAMWTGVVAMMLVMPVVGRWVRGFDVPLLPQREQAIQTPLLIEVETAPSANEPASIPKAVAENLPYSRSISWENIALSVYGLVVLLLLLRLGIGTYHVKRLLATSALDRGQRVHPACTTPITVGWLRPVVILPTSWTEWPAERLHAVFAHEQHHVERRDPLIQWLALLNRAIFWFHPLAWWLERELANLAEQSCDESVLADGIDSGEYSKALVFLARAANQSGARIQLGTAMPGPALYGRLRSILDGARPQVVSPWRLTGIAVTLTIAAFLLSTGKLAHAQSSQAFEVATVKPAAPGAPGRMLRLVGPGQISIKNFTLKDIVQWAYGPGTLTITGGPKWMDSQAASDSFDIEAKAPANTTEKQGREMMRTLLAERFNLKAHTEQKEVPAYALVPARSDRRLGPNMTEMTGKPCESGRSAPPDSGIPRCRAGISPQGLTMEGATMKQLADLLSIPITDLGRPVVDRTNIPGDFKVNLEFTFRTMPDGPRTGETGPSLFTALQEQLGLKLENARASIEVLIIDSADRPTEN